MEQAIADGRQRLLEGQFRGALAVADEALERSPRANVSQRVELLRIKAVSLIALDRTDDARQTFIVLRRLDPTYRLDPKRTSPKILEVFHSVGDLVD